MLSFWRTIEGITYGQLLRKIGEMLRELCQCKGVELDEGTALPDHIHMLLSVPPKCSIPMTIGYLESKSAIQIHRQLVKRKGRCLAAHFGQEVVV